MNVTPSPEDVETLFETFKCFICLEKVENAHICPYCSKLCCFTCIQQWFSQKTDPRRPNRSQKNSHCPHCRNSLNLNEIIQCRWIGDLSKKLDSLYIDMTRKTQDPRCKIHNERLTVFCVTCNLAICHRCALFDSLAHSDHSFRPIEEVHYETILEIENRSNNLIAKHELIKQGIDKIDSHINILKAAKDQRNFESMIDLVEITMNFEKEFEERLTTLETRKKLLLKESEEIRIFLEQRDFQFSSMPMAQLIKSVPEFNKTITAMENKQIPALRVDLMSLDKYDHVYNELIPTLEEGTLVIKSFSSKRPNSEPIYSQPIGCNGVSWRLKVYPNDGFVADKYVSAFLELTSGPSRMTRYDCCIQIIASNGNTDTFDNVFKKFTIEFKTGQCRGFRRFACMDLLYNGKFLLEDSLVFKFSVRPSSYFQKCKEQLWYVSKLELEKSAILQQCEELKQEINVLTRTYPDVQIFNSKFKP